MMRSRLPNRLVAGATVLTAVAVGGVGGAMIGFPGLSGAQPFPAAATTAAADAVKAAGEAGPMKAGSPLLDAAAKALDLTTAQLQQKLSDGKTTIADVAKQQNVSVDTVIAAMATADRDRITKIVNSPWPARGAFGPGKGFGPPGFGGLRAGFGRFAGVELDAVAKALGITTQELQADLAKGQTIAQIAKSKNIDVNSIINTLVGDANAKIDRAVKDGHLQQATADKLKALAKTAVTNFVNNGLPKGPPGGFGFGFPGHRGFGGPKPGSPPPTA
jgi:hypothetical protein